MVQVSKNKALSKKNSFLMKLGGPLNMQSVKNVFLFAS
jgi:hypothetical protein